MSLKQKIMDKVLTENPHHAELEEGQNIKPPEAESIAAFLANAAIVLMEPKYPENIGAAARSGMNMGIKKLIVVRNEPPDREKMLKTATHNAAHIIDNMELHTELATALAPFSWVVGTTARQGRQRRNISTPRYMVGKLLPLLKNNRVALLFGPEDRGLTNDDLKFCNLTTTIPTADFSSLNLAQAVAIHCHELYSGLLEATFAGKKNEPKLAESIEMEAMYAHVEEMLQHIGFLKPADCRYWMHTIRQFLSRIGLRAKEARMIRGFCRQLIRHDKESCKKIAESGPGH